MSRINWTAELVAKLHECTAAGMPHAAIAQRMGLSASAIDNAVRRYGRGERPVIPVMLPPPPLVDPVAEHVAQQARRLERDERKKLLQRLADAEKRNQFWSDLHSSPTPPDVPRREFQNGVREGTAVALLSDAHIEEHVDAGKVADRNAYNLEISASRMDRFFQGVKWLIGHNRGAWAIRDLVLWFGGDLMTGYIHDELIESNLLSPTETVLVLRRRLSSGIKLLLRDAGLELITIPCNYGNHGRIGQKRRVKTGAESSYEWMLYQLMAEDFAYEPRVRFEIPRGAHTYVTAYGKTLHFHHGDEITYYGGIGGLTIPLGKRVPKWDNVKHADLHHIGHFHQFTDLGHTMVNGSVIGYSEYAFSIGADFEPPQQGFYVLDSKRGKTNMCPIWVEESE